MMEKHVFHRPAVAAELRNWVEARLHTDDVEHGEVLRALEQRLAQSRANPVYLLMDPETERIIDRVDGARPEGEFLDFLKSARTQGG